MKIYCYRLSECYQTIIDEIADRVCAAAQYSGNAVAGYDNHTGIDFNLTERRGIK